MRTIALALVLISSLAQAGVRKKPADDQLKKELTLMQYEVTQHSGTEPPFHNVYFDNHAAGIYVDIVTGEPLFSSTEKFESGTGWPSFWAPIEGTKLVEVHDGGHGMDRGLALLTHPVPPREPARQRAVGRHVRARRAEHRPASTR